MADVTHQKTYSHTVFKASYFNQLKENLHHYGRKQAKKRFRTPIETISNPNENDFAPLCFYII
jgi:hypothetical protein